MDGAWGSSWWRCGNFHLSPGNFIILVPSSTNSRVISPPQRLIREAVIFPLVLWPWALFTLASFTLCFGLEPLSCHNFSLENFAIYNCPLIILWCAQYLYSFGAIFFIALFWYFYTYTLFPLSFLCGVSAHEGAIFVLYGAWRSSSLQYILFINAHLGARSSSFMPLSDN